MLFALIPPKSTCVRLSTLLLAPPSPLVMVRRGVTLTRQHLHGPLFNPTPSLPCPFQTITTPNLDFVLTPNPFLTSTTVRFPSPRTLVVASFTLSKGDGPIRPLNGTPEQSNSSSVFCDEEHVPEHLRFPADEFVLCAFAASSFKKHAGGTPRSRITALKAWHAAHNVEWRGST